MTRSYPANYFRLHLLLKSFIEKDIKRIVEVGVGEGTPLITLANAGIEVAGFDISKKMLDKCQHNFKKNKLSGQIIWGDIQDPITYAPLLSDGQYDALLSRRVMPHVRNDDFTYLENKQEVQFINNENGMIVKLPLWKNQVLQSHKDNIKESELQLHEKSIQRITSLLVKQIEERNL